MKFLWITYLLVAMPAALFFYFFLFSLFLVETVFSKNFGEADEPGLTLVEKILTVVTMFVFSSIWSISFFYGKKLLNTRYEIFMIILNLILSISVLYLAICFVKSEGYDLIWMPIYIASIAIILFIALILNLTKKKSANKSAKSEAQKACIG